MRRHLHTIVLVIFALALMLDFVFWGAVEDLPDVGAHIARSAHSEAVLASAYMFIGGFLDSAVSSLHGFGTSVMTDALSPVFARIIEAPNLAMDLIFSETSNSTHRWVKWLYWAPPILLVLYALLWAIRPKNIKLIPTR